MTEEQLLGLIWNHQKDPSMPLWWCLADEHKETFRAAIAAEVARRDPATEPPWPVRPTTLDEVLDGPDIYSVVDYERQSRGTCTDCKAQDGPCWCGDTLGCTC